MKLNQNYESLNDDKLTKYSNKVFESLSSHLDEEDIETLNHLLEVERALTLREESPNY